MTQPSSLDVYIIERIIKALEVVTEMNTDVVRLRDSQDRHEKILGEGEFSLSSKIHAVQTQLAQVMEDVQHMHTAKREETEANVTGKWGLRAVMITSATGLITGVLSLVSQWLK